MNQNESLVRIDRLIDIAKKNPRDIAFIQNHLTQKNQAIFSGLLNDKNIKEKKVKIKKKTHLSRTYMLTIFDEPQFTAELALSLSKQYPDKKIAILDGDRFDPRLDVYLNTHSHIKSVFTHLDFRRTTGLNLLIDANNKHVLTKQYADHLSIRVDGYKNIKYFSGNYLIEDYEYYKLHDYKKVIQFLKMHYDFVLISVNKFIYDAYTCQSLMSSDFNLISLRGSLPDVIEKKKYIQFLVNKQKIDVGKNKYFLFDYNANIHIKEKLVRELVNGDYLGHIPYSSTRSKGIYKNYSLTKHLKKRNMMAYLKLFNRLGEFIS